MTGEKDERIIKPRPIKGFGQKEVLYIPVDLPYLNIHRLLKKAAKKIKNTSFGQLYGFKNRVILSGCIGAPLAVMVLERLIASGAQEILILGFCGALGKISEIGESVSVTTAVSDEGTSRHYFPKRRIFRASSQLKARIENILSERSLPFETGSIVSTDAPFRETQNWLDRNRARGVGYVDMETSAVFALADYYGIQAAALHLVSDQLTSSSHRTGFHSIELSRNTRKYFLPLIDPDL